MLFDAVESGSRLPKVRAALCALALLWALPVTADDVRETPFTFTVPAGWVHEAVAEGASGLHAMLRNEGQSFSLSSTVVYVRSIPKGPGARSIEAVVQTKVAESRAKGSPRFQQSRVKTLALAEGRKAVVYHYKNNPDGILEAAAYIDEADVINVFVLSAINRRSFTQSLAKFEQLVRSYVPRPARVEQTAEVSAP